MWPLGWSKLRSSKPTFGFTDNNVARDAFFKRQCKYGDTKIEPGKGVVAMVLDASREFPGIPVAVMVEADGSQQAVLKVISEDGGFIVVAGTPPGKGEPLKLGDIVEWVPREFIYSEYLPRAREITPFRCSNVTSHRRCVCMDTADGASHKKGARARTVTTGVLPLLERAVGE